jgi:hypothetical protein
MLRTSATVGGASGAKIGFLFSSSIRRVVSALKGVGDAYSLFSFPHGIDSRRIVCRVRWGRLDIFRGAGSRQAAVDGRDEGGYAGREQRGGGTA